MGEGATDARFGLYVLGRVTFTRSGEPVKLPHQVLKVLALLVLNGSTMHRDAIAGHMWPDARVASGRHQLRNVLTVLRSTGLAVERQGEAVVILDDVYCDAEDFILSASKAVAGLDGPAERYRCCLHAQSLWAGGPLEPWRFQSWALPVRERAFGLQRQLWAMSHTLPVPSAWPSEDPGALPPA